MLIRKNIKFGMVAIVWGYLLNNLAPDEDKQEKKIVSQATCIFLLLSKESNTFLLMLMKECPDKKDWTS